MITRKEHGQLNLAHTYLAKGEWDKGWAEWHKSLGGKFRKEWVYGDEVRWDGTKDKTLIIYGEQGLGDEIFYGSCIPDAISSSKQVYIDCDPSGRVTAEWVGDNRLTVIAFITN